MNDTPEKPKLSWWRRLSSGLKRTSSSLGSAVAALVTKRKLDAAMLEDIEDVLLRADLGTEVAARIAKAVGVGRYDKSISADDVKDYVAKHLASYKKPRIVEFLDELPVTPTGKVNRKLLRDASLPAT